MKKQNTSKPEIHLVPSSDRKFKHFFGIDCPCKPVEEKVKDKAGLRIFMHNKMGRGQDLWRAKFGLNGKEIDGEKFFESVPQKTAAKLLEAINEFQSLHDSDKE